MVVKASRLKRYETKGLFLRPRCDIDISPRGSGVSDPMLPRKAAYRATFVIVLQTDSGGRGEYPKARERTLVKELGKFTP